jgi:polyisoprenoid-binding protein YceI
MQRNTIIIIIAAVGIAGVAYFMYLTRPVATPEGNITDQTTPLSQEGIADGTAGEDAPANTEAGKIYQVDQSKSTATFKIDEELRGEPFTAVGITNQIAGEFRVKENSDGTSTLTVGTLKIDARTFKTDSPQRDGAIVRMILKSETTGNEYITFTPTKSEVTASSLMKGKATFSVPGTMTISGVSKPVIFSVTGSVVNGSLVGDAAAKIKRSDFKLTIPNIPFVANVADEFLLSSHIVAAAQ